jgi:hypothetical protein
MHNREPHTYLPPHFPFPRTHTLYTDTRVQAMPKAHACDYTLLARLPLVVIILVIDLDLSLLPHT